MEKEQEQNSSLEVIEHIRHMGEYAFMEELMERHCFTEQYFVYNGHMKRLDERTDLPPDQFYNGDPPVSYEIFKSVWNDPVTYFSTEDIYNVLVPSKSSSVVSSTKNSTVTRIRKHFLKHTPKASSELIGGNTSTPQQARRNYREKLVNGEIEDEIGKGTNDDPIGASSGRRRSQTGAVEKINDEDVFQGEFYIDRTRIPKRRWGIWFTKWMKRASSVKEPDYGSFLKPFKRWSKHFVMGYNVENMTYEIWYNTADSTFSLHDKNGNTLTGEMTTIRQATKGLFDAIAQFSTKDAEFFQSGRAKTYFDPAGISSEMQARAREAENEEAKQQQQRAKKASKKQRKMSQKAKSQIDKNMTKLANMEVDGEEEDERNLAYQDTVKAASQKRQDKQSAVADRISAQMKDAEVKPKRKRKNAKGSVEPRTVSPTPYGSSSSGRSGATWKTENVNEQQGVELSMDQLTNPEGNLNPLYNDNADKRVAFARDQAKQVNTSSLSSEILGEVEQYDETKFKTSRGLVRRSVDWLKNKFRILRGRAAPLESPVNYTTSYVERTKGFFRGVDVRGDFITGFELGPLQLEVWYIQEMDLYDRSGQKQSFFATDQKASYYVYDVQANKVIAQNLPFLRLALQAVVMKMGAPSANG